MSHFSVAVFTSQNSGTVYDLLAPYDENIEMPRYIEATKAELIADERASIERYNKTVYADFQRDPEKYLRERCGGNKDSHHYQYISKEFPLKLLWSDEDMYQHAIGYYDADNIGENGEVYSTYNPK